MAGTRGGSTLGISEDGCISLDRVAEFKKMTSEPKAADFECDTPHASVKAIIYPTKDQEYYWLEIADASQNQGDDLLIDKYYLPKRLFDKLDFVSQKNAVMEYLKQYPFAGQMVVNKPYSHAQEAHLRKGAVYIYPSPKDEAVDDGESDDILVDEGAPQDKPSTQWWTVVYADPHTREAMRTRIDIPGSEAKGGSIDLETWVYKIRCDKELKGAELHQLDLIRRIDKIYIYSAEVTPYDANNDTVAFIDEDKYHNAYAIVTLRAPHSEPNFIRIHKDRLKPFIDFANAQYAMTVLSTDDRGISLKRILDLHLKRHPYAFVRELTELVQRPSSVPKPPDSEDTDSKKSELFYLSPLMVELSLNLRSIVTGSLSLEILWEYSPLQLLFGCKQGQALDLAVSALDAALAQPLQSPFIDNSAAKRAREQIAKELLRFKDSAARFFKQKDQDQRFVWTAEMWDELLGPIVNIENLLESYKKANLGNSFWYNSAKLFIAVAISAIAAAGMAAALAHMSVGLIVVASASAVTFLFFFALVGAAMALDHSRSLKTSESGLSEIGIFAKARALVTAADLTETEEVKSALQRLRTTSA